MALNNLTAMMFVVNIAKELILARAFHTIGNKRLAQSLDMLFSEI